MDWSNFYADMRWRSQGWREAFRFRMTGGLPVDWVEQGLATGVIVAGKDASAGVYELTPLGRELTVLHPSRMTEETIRMLAITLLAVEFERNWLTEGPGPEDAVLAEGTRFSEDFRGKVVTHFDREMQLVQ